MDIGIIGSGNMGAALGQRFAGSGHRVLFGSRDADKGRALAEKAGNGAQSGDFAAAAKFGELLIYTVRGVFPSALLGDVTTLAGKIVIDVNNTDLTPDARPIDPGGPTLVEQLAADVPAARVVKAFTSTPAQVIALPRYKLAEAQVATLICGNDEAARAQVMHLASELGFSPVDCGGLAYSRTVDGAADFVRFQIANRGLGPFAVLSLRVLSP